MFRRVITALLRGFYAVFHPIRIDGAELLPKSGPYMLTLNHLSFRDAAVALLITPADSRFMAKKELFMFKPVASFISGLGAFPVDRENNDISAVRTAIGCLKDGHPLILFPEGHRYTDGEIHPLKPGALMIAARAAVPVIPARIHTRYLPFQKVWVRIGEPLQAEKPLNSESLTRSTALLETRMKSL